MTKAERDALTKVRAVTLGFWTIKILATTLGETAGDTVSMTMDLGYLAGTGIFLSLLLILAWLQIRARAFHPFLYWATIIASTTAGTTMADFATRSMGIGYPGGSMLLLGCVIAALICGHRSLGSVSVDTVSEPRAELFYWVTITFSQTLGTALGDWTADTGGLGYLGAAYIFAGLLAIVAAAYVWTKVDRIHHSHRSHHRADRRHSTACGQASRQILIAACRGAAPQGIKVANRLCLSGLAIA